MKLGLPILIVTATFAGEAATPRSEFAAGRTCYINADFKKAAAHFSRALDNNPSDAEAAYWAGMSYQVLSDIASPFSGGRRSAAHSYFRRAMQLEPGRS